MPQTITAEFNVELTFEVEASYSPGYPATGPTYACGGTPPEPAEIEIEKVVRVGVPYRDKDGWKTRWITLTDAQQQALAEIVATDVDLFAYAADAAEETVGDSAPDYEPSEEF